MRRRASLVLTLVAWLFATGSHWDLLQTFGWGKMIASYSKTMPFSEALQRTFSPEAMCGVCIVVASAKQKEADTTAIPGGKLDSKILLSLVTPPNPVVVRPAAQFMTPLRTLVPASTRAAPPVPPPRSLAA